MLDKGAALIQGLRQRGDEPQLTRALASVFQADPSMGAQFVNLVLKTVSEGRAGSTPRELRCSTEEVVEDGRLDLRFRADGWDVIVELKIYASYGRDQLDRYLNVLDKVDSAYVTAITRSVPIYGEPDRNVDPRWLGSVQWRRLLPELRKLQSRSPALSTQWLLFLDVLEEEGSMGFTKPEPELFAMLGQLRSSAKHAVEFMKALQMPLYEALVQALGGDETAAALYKTRGGGLYIGRSWNGIIETAFRIPPTGPPRIRAGVFAYKPPVRFFVAPHTGRRWITRLGRLSPEAQAAVRFLIDHGFRDHDLHSFLELDENTLLSPTLEDIVEWAHARFVDIVNSGILLCNAEPEPVQTVGAATEDVDGLQD